MNTNNDSQRIVLLVDDAPMNLKILSAMIRKLGAEPVEVGSGPEALAYVAEHPVHAVLTDLWMLEMNGADLAEAIHAKLPDVPVYGVTADAESPDNPLFRSKHLKEILVKPVSLGALKSILASLH